MSVALISHPDCLLHDMNHLLPEVAERLIVIEDVLSQSDIAHVLKPYLAPLATQAQLLRAHTQEYIDYIFQSAPTNDFFCLDPDTWMGPNSLQASLYAAGASILAVDLVLKGEVSTAFCNIRPPGHHATKNQAMGFCIFNNVAVGVLHALEHHHLKRIAIVDFDAHHGNGLEDIFKKDERVLYCSSFEHPFYPFSGADTRSSHIINIPLPAGTEGNYFREKAAECWFPALIEFNPDMIFFSAGFDADQQDLLSDLMLKEDDYAWITRKIMAIANQVCSGQVVSVLEGGYALEILGSCALAHVRELQKNK